MKLFFVIACLFFLAAFVEGEDKTTGIDLKENKVTQDDSEGKSDSDKSKDNTENSKPSDSTTNTDAVDNNESKDSKGNNDSKKSEGNSDKKDDNDSNGTKDNSNNNKGHYRSKNVLFPGFKHLFDTILGYNSDESFSDSENRLVRDTEDTLENLKYFFSPLTPKEEAWERIFILGYDNTLKDNEYYGMKWKHQDFCYYCDICKVKHGYYKCKECTISNCL